MVGLSNFILSVNYFSKTFEVVQEFMISKGLKVNNPLFAKLPEDPNNYNDVIPLVQNKSVINNNPRMNNAFNNNIMKRNIINKDANNNINNNMNEDNLNENLNINDIIGGVDRIKRTQDLNKSLNQNQTELENNNNLNNSINNNQNQNMQINYFQRRVPHIGLFQRINNRIGVPIAHRPLPHIQSPFNTFEKKRTLMSLVALQNDDILAIGSKDCWILRNNSIKYVIYKEQIINNCERIINIKKAVAISDNEFVIEASIKIHQVIFPHGMIFEYNQNKNDYLYIFFNLEYEEIKRKTLTLFETMINFDNDYIYIKDFQSLYLMDKKNKEVINIFEMNTIGPIIPIKSNKSFIIQERENNAIVEYRIIDNEIVKSQNLIVYPHMKLIEGLDDDFNTLIIRYKKESVLFLQQ